MTKNKDTAFSFPSPFGDMASYTPDLQGNMQALFDAHRKNIQSMNTIGQMTLETMQDVAEKQKTVFSKIMAQTTALANDTANVGKPEDKMANNLKALQKNYELLYANMQDISDTLKNTGNEAATILRKRATETVKDVKKAAAVKDA